jgi:hypothetical protein
MMEPGGFMTRVRHLALAGLLIVIASAPARADITGFVGVNTTPANRVVTGGALSISLLVAGFEVEYAQTRPGDLSLAPSLRTGMGNVFAQNPIPIAGITFYATSGAGIFREELGSTSTTNFGVNVGGGAKIDLVSHVRLRIDYRVFKLAGNPLNPMPTRIYMGLSLSL